MTPAGGTYRISDVTLSSEIAMPELPAATGRADWTFTIASRRLATSPPVWFHRWCAASQSLNLLWLLPIRFECAGRR